MDTWTIRPAADFQYVYTWRRTIFTLNSDPTYFHTESFNASNPERECQRRLGDLDEQD